MIAQPSLCQTCSETLSSVFSEGGFYMSMNMLNIVLINGKKGHFNAKSADKLPL